MTDSIETNVNGYIVRRDFGDSEPRIHDLELAERLGYSRPRKLRDLIRSMAADGKLNEVAQRTVAGRRDDGMPAKPHTEFWLTERQALKVIAKSETAIADRILDEVIDVFVAVRKSGAVPPTQAHLLLAPIPSTWEDTFGELQRTLWRLYGRGLPYPDRSPFALRRINGIIYKLLLGDEVYAELKARNPNPRFDSNHHQYISDEARPGFLRQLSAILAIAETSHNKADFRARIRWLYRGRPMQLLLGGAA